MPSTSASANKYDIVCPISTRSCLSGAQGGKREDETGYNWIACPLFITALQLRQRNISPSLTIAILSRHVTISRANSITSTRFRGIAPIIQGRGNCDAIPHPKAYARANTGTDSDTRTNPNPAAGYPNLGAKYQHQEDTLSILLVCIENRGSKLRYFHRINR